MIRSSFGLKKKTSAEDSQSEWSHHRREEGGSHQHQDDESNWLVSYADMMTLLCGFFIMLFSLTKMDEPQFEKIKATMAEQFGGEYRSPNEQMAKWVTQILQETPLKGEASVETSASGVAIVFRSQVFFDTLSAELTPNGRGILEELVEALQQRQKFEKKAFRFVVEGHTDSRAVLSGPFVSNWELSAARAARVVRVFVDKGFSGRSMAALGYADTRPVEEARLADGKWNELALAKNRRVVIRVFHDAEAQALAQLAEEEAARRPATTDAGSAPSQTGSPGQPERGPQ